MLRRDGEYVNADLLASPAVSLLLEVFTEAFAGVFEGWAEDCLE